MIVGKLVWIGIFVIFISAYWVSVINLKFLSFSKGARGGLGQAGEKGEQGPPVNMNSIYI